jgi:hypothetical protein
VESTSRGCTSCGRSSARLARQMARSGKSWANVGTEHRWTASFDRCARDTDVVSVGTIRTCALGKPLMGRTAVFEELTEYEPGLGRSLPIGSRGARLFASASSHWSTTSRSDGGTIVTVEHRVLNLRPAGAGVLSYRAHIRSRSASITANGTSPQGFQYGRLYEYGNGGVRSSLAPAAEANQADIERQLVDRLTARYFSRSGGFSIKL